MNTENKKTFCRFFICILFWTIIFCLGFLLVQHGVAGTGNGGRNGTGSGGRNGSGTGQGQSTAVIGERNDSTGKSQNARTKGNPETAASAAPKNANTRTAETAAPSRTENPKAQLKVLSAEAASEDIATIYRTGKSTDNGIPAGTSAGFFGVAVTGSSIFLLDTSGSMGSSSSEGKSRLELVKLEMEKTLNSKFKDTLKHSNHDRFRIVCFSTDCHFLPEQQLGGYKYASANDVAEALKIVKQLFPHGGTQMKHAWDMIIPILKRDKIKSVYFLSDGDPTDCKPDDLLADLKAAVPDLTIHTISMGQPSVLLQEIAKQHGGQYREVY